MGKGVLTKTLSEVFRSIGTSQNSHIKTCCISQLHSDIKRFGTEIDLQKKSKKQDVTKLIYPKLSDDVRERLETVSSFHITTSSVSWAKMSSTRKLLEWELIEIPNEMDKVHLTTIYEMVLKITNLLPKSNVYVIEEMNKSKQSSTSAFHSNTYLLQFRAILLAYLNEFEIPCEESDEPYNKVYFLRSQLAARLSSTLVGREKVAVEQTVTNILNISGHSGNCPQYSPLNVDRTLKQKYLSKESVDKENMGQALLLVMAFMDLVFNRRQQSLDYIRKIH